MDLPIAPGRGQNVMTLRYVETSDAIIVFMTGFAFFDDAIDLGSNSQFRDLCKLAGSAGKKLIIDLSPLEIMSSLTLGLLVVFHKISVQYAVELRLANARANIRDIFRITQLDRIVRFDDDDDPDLFGAAVPLPKPPSTSSGRAESNHD